MSGTIIQTRWIERDENGDGGMHMDVVAIPDDFEADEYVRVVGEALTNQGKTFCLTTLRDCNGHGVVMDHPYSQHWADVT